ncbi:MAG TPA: TonB-dependent receptor [Flavisolibacter sp.]|nr:TonB-dependent receptor [Flavisolibacter sp.]
MTYKTAALCWLLLLATTGWAQSEASVSGTIVDRNNQTPLVGITVTINPGNLTTLSDSIGTFRFAGIAPGSFIIRFSGTGYQSKLISNIVFTTGNITTLNVELDAAVKELESVTITGKRNTVRATTLESPLSIQRLTTEEIKANPGGNFDISRVIQSLPGVGGGIGGGSFRNDIIIRGGAPSENVFYLDGIEVPVINHFSTQGSSGGPQGILNVSFIEEVKLSTSAFDARYDNVLSSVFQFRQKTGNNSRLQGNFRLSGTEVAATFDGPLSQNTTFLFSARRSYLEFLFSIIDLPIRPNYWDFQAKTTTRINSKTTLSFLGIGAIDEFRFGLPKEATPEKLYVISSSPFINQWTYTIGASLRRLVNNGYWNLSLSRNTLDNRVDKFMDNQDPQDMERTLMIRSNETENKLRFDVTKNSRDWKFTYGLVTQYVQFDNRFEQVFRPELRDNQGNITQEKIAFNSATGRDFLRYGAFLQAGRRFFNNRLALSGGVRADANSLDNGEQNPLKQFSPRISASYALNDKLNASSSYGIYYRLPSYTQIAFTNAAGASINPGQYIRSTHLAGGLEYLPNSNFRMTAEGFYKKYAAYPVSLPEGISLANKGTEFGAIGNEPVVQNGEGRAYGFELFLQQKLSKRFFGVFSYTLYWSEFSGINGRFAPAAWDNRHLVTYTMGYKLPRNLEVGLKFRYQDAAPYTPFDLEQSRANFLTLGTGILNNALVNTKRLPAFHAGDLRIDKKWNFRRLTFDLFFDIQNFYGSKSIGAPQYTFRRNNDNTAFVTTDGNPVNINGSNAIPFILENRDGSVLPTIGFIVEF